MTTKGHINKGPKLPSAARSNHPSVRQRSAVSIVISARILMVNEQRERLQRATGKMVTVILRWDMKVDLG